MIRFRKKSGDEQLGWQVGNPPLPRAPHILFQLRQDKLFCHHDPAKELMTKARLMIPGPTALWFHLGSLRPPWKPSLALGRRKGRSPASSTWAQCPASRATRPLLTQGLVSMMCVALHPLPFPAFSLPPISSKPKHLHPLQFSLALAPGKGDSSLDWQPPWQRNFTIGLSCNFCKEAFLTRQDWVSGYSAASQNPSLSLFSH